MQRAVWASAFLVGTVLFSISCGKAPQDIVFRKGMGLGLYSADPYYDYRPLIREIDDLGANAIALFVCYFQENGSSDFIYFKEKRTIPTEMLRRVIRYCNGKGLEVTLVPIILLDKPREGEWRGNMKPDDPVKWFESYTELVTKLAELSADEGASWFCVGSELASMESYSDEWAAVIEQCRAVFPGRLTYAANWDQLEKFKHWQKLDAMSMSGYFELADHTEPTLDELIGSWEKWKIDIFQTRERLALTQLPLWFIEIGYPSQDGAAQYPWNYTLDRPIDLEEQRLCYEAFITTWHEAPKLEGVYWYNFFGDGGPDDGDYTPRGKPALNEIKRWYAQEIAPGEALPILPAAE